MPDSYRQIFLSLSDAVFVEDADSIILDANTAAAWLLGYPRTELIGRKSTEFLAPASRERLAEQRHVLKTVEHHQFDAQYLNATGAVINVILDFSLLPEYSGHGSDGSEAHVYLVVARQASKRDELERELRLQRCSAAAVNILVHRAAFFISSRNEIIRYPPLAPGEAPGELDWTSMLPQTPTLKPAMERAWAGEDVSIPAAWYSPPPGAQDDILPRAHWLKISLHPIRLRGADVTDLFVRIVDETGERLRREDQNWENQRRLATLQTNALFHDLNNYLAVILAQASGLRLEVPQGQLPPPGLGAIMDAAQQAASLLRRSTDASEESAAQQLDVSLNELLKDCVPLLAQMAASSIDVSIETAPDLPLVSGNPVLLKTLIMAMSRCALTAMSGSGRMSVKTFRIVAGMPSMPPSAGLSINADSAERTTDGHVLDLALARAILRHHRGQLETASSSDQGLLWEITIPGVDTENKATSSAVNKKDRTFSKTDTGIQTLRRSGGKILLADDEENFRLFTSWALQERGYEVISAKDGQEAFDRFRDAPETFALVILDAYMPRMGGLEAYLRMQVLRPDLPVLFASGFARGASVDALVSGCPGPAAVLLKPFSSEDLLMAVGKALAPH